MNTKERNILWLDDDEVLKLIADQILAPYNDLISKYCYFSDGYQALAYLKDSDETNEFPDLLLIDLKMPEMDGIEFLNNYASLYPKKYPTSQVYVLTSSARSADIEKATSFDFVSDYIVKPLSGERLEDLLRK